MNEDERFSFFATVRSFELQDYIHKRDLYTFHKDDLGQHSPLDFAVALIDADMDVILKLVDMGANPFGKVGPYSDPAIFTMIRSNLTISQIELIISRSRWKVDWNVKNIGGASCSLHAAKRRDKEGLEFLHRQGIDLKATVFSKPYYSAFSIAIEEGPLENVKYLHSIGCTYPEYVRDNFRKIFVSQMGKYNGTAPSVVAGVEINQTSTEATLQRERWRKIKFLVEARIIEPYFLRDWMPEYIKDDLQRDFWRSVDPSIAVWETECLTNFDGEFLLRKLNEADGLEIRKVEELKNNNTGEVGGHRLEVTEKWLQNI